MKFKQFFKNKLIFENPDNVYITDEKGEEKNVSYFTCHGYSVMFGKLPTSDDFKIVIMKDTHDANGHMALRGYLRNKSFNHIITDMDEATVDKFEYDNFREIIKSRIWSDFKIMSFWDFWKPEYVDPALKALKMTKQMPERYRFEMGGATLSNYTKNTCKDCLTYDEFVKGKQLTPEEKAEQQAKIDRAREDAMLLNKMKFGIGMRREGD